MSKRGMKIKTTKMGFVLNRPFQILNALNYLYYQNEFSRVYTAFFILDCFPNAKKIADNIQKIGLVDEVYCFGDESETKENKERSKSIIEKKIEYICEYYLPAKAVRATVKNVKCVRFDCLFFTTDSNLVYYLRRSNPHATVGVIEDGSGSYYDDYYIKRFYHYAPVVSFKQRLFSKIVALRGGRLDYAPQNVYLYQPEIFINREYSFDFEINKLYSPREWNDDFLGILTTVFDYKPEEVYKKNKVVFLSGYSLSDVEIDILNCIEKKRIKTVLRLHPFFHMEDITKKYSNMVIDNNNEWELVCRFQLQDSNILIGICSHAQLVPVSMFDKEPILILLYRLIYQDNKKELSAYEKLKNDIISLYKHKDRIHVPNTIEEFKDILNKIAVD